MKLIGIIVLVLGGSAFAGGPGYDLKMDLSMNGKHVFSPRVIAKAGETATATHKTDTEETFIEVIPTEGTIQNKKGILMQMTIGTINKAGQRTVLSKPRVLANENETATMTVENKNSKISLSVLVQRKAL